jgi:cytochrome bd-type quinol oxidase subunit 1
MPVQLHALIGFLVHALFVWAVLQFIETQWPTLHRMIRALIISAVVAFLIAVLHGWVCGWLCR